MDDQKNLVIAIVLSLGIMVGFHYFVERPQLEARQAALAEQAKLEAAQPANQEAVPHVSLPQQAPDRNDVVAKTPRVHIESDKIRGSISLTGGRIDDVVLKEHRQEVAKDSPPITLLSPTGSTTAYYADFGWVAAGGTVKVPTAQTVWKADDAVLEGNDSVTLTWDNGEGVRFEQIYSLDKGYMFEVKQRVVNTSKKAISLNPYGLISRSGTPTLSGFFILHEGPLGVFNGKLQEIKYEDLRKEKQKTFEAKGGWLGITDKYWLVSLVPPQVDGVKSNFTHTLNQTIDRYQTDYILPSFSLEPGATHEVSSHLFAGAKSVELIEGYEKSLGIDNFDLAIDYGWFYFLTKPLFKILNFIHSLLGNFGLAILVLTVLVRLLLFPLANKSYHAMAKMRKLGPQIEKLKERCGDDRMRMQQEMMALYKKEGVNPAAGCLPLLIQIPVFFALYKVLFINIEMRHAPFYGWIHDLSAPDPTSVFNLFGLLPFAAPFHVGAWPIIMGVTMFLQQKLSPKPSDPVQANVMMFLPVMFVFLLGSFPAGLVIYWAWGNVLSLIQQWLIMRGDNALPSANKR